jgi:hypothetical protein
MDIASVVTTLQMEKVGGLFDKSDAALPPQRRSRRCHPSETPTNDDHMMAFLKSLFLKQRPQQIEGPCLLCRECKP